MAFTKKTPLQKFGTKIGHLLSSDARFKKIGSTIKFDGLSLFSFDKKKIDYGKTRIYLTKIDSISKDNYTVTIPLNNENLSLIGSKPANPPSLLGMLVPFFEKSFKTIITKVVLGANQNKRNAGTLYLTKELYQTLGSINQEERDDKNVRFENRALFFLNDSFGLSLKAKEIDRDYDLLLKELIASGNINQEDLMAISNKLNPGNSADVVIKQQVHKQVEWLIQKMQEIVDTDPINKAIAKNIGNKYFGFLKTEIVGPEHLMEMILTKYGQYTIFGAPVLLNTNKYVINSKGLSRSQFDILLITHLSDLEVVELKRPDTIILDFDEGRNKFFASRELSIAISQAERYISAVYRDNDEDYTIDKLKIREYIHREIGGTMTVEVTRPSALIVIGRHQSIAADYNSLSDKTRKKIKKTEYDKNAMQAYKELKGAHKNITITSYSDLLDMARTRMIIDKAVN